MQYAELRPEFSASLFPPPKPKAVATDLTNIVAGESSGSGLNISRRRSRNNSRTGLDVVDVFDEFDNDCLEDGELMAASTKIVLSSSFCEPEVLILSHSE